jgi:hypothetical protein
VQISVNSTLLTVGKFIKHSYINALTFNEAVIIGNLTRHNTDEESKKEALATLW